MSFDSHFTFYPVMLKKPHRKPQKMQTIYLKHYCLSILSASEQKCFHFLQTKKKKLELSHKHSETEWDMAIFWEVYL